MNNTNSTTLIIKDEDLGDEKIKVDYKKIQKMAFIYDALENNWTIKKLKNNTYEFTNDTNQKIKIDKFLKKHMKTKDILKN